MKLLLTGLNHRTAPVEVRERLAFDEKALPGALDDLKRCPGLIEGMILSTCNRVEVAVTADEHADPESAVESFLAGARKVERKWVSPYLYRFNGTDAIRHLFRVASSLDSMVVGEPQILGQLKSAYALAKERGTVGGFLDQVLTRAFNVAKRVRSETEIGENAVSVSYAAVELARDIFGSLQGKRVLMIGAGKMAESAARHLQHAGVSEILVTNRTRERGEALANEVGGRVIPYDGFHSAIPEVDILLASSGATGYVITKEEMRLAIGKRRNRPMFLIDIAVPRNIEPTVDGLDNVFRYDIDDLGKVVDQNLRGRVEVARQAEDIIREEVDRMVLRLKTRDHAPEAVLLQEELERWRIGEIERRRSKLGDLTPQQEETLHAITRAITNKFFHKLITEQRRAQAAGDE